jgi:hypothetical protein
VATHEFASTDFDMAAYRAGRSAFQEMLALGLPVFYVDTEGVNVMEAPDGRRFEIRWLIGGPPEANYEIVRELKARAA